MKTILLVCFLIILIAPDIRADDKDGVPQSKEDEARIINRKFFVNNRFYRQGGIGIIGDSVYVVASSNNNEIIQKDRSSWIGKNKSIKQVIYIINGKVCDPATDPNTFSLLDCALVSFEPERIYVFDFQSFHGGYYLRDK